MCCLLVSSDAAERFASTCALERCVHEVQKRSAAFISRYFAKKEAGPSGAYILEN